ncbi:MAG TPA: glycosyltransferase family 4 protein [Polyangiaceae bacterium]|nr:glycosyltransferase family 4 protein [Polyangiaceae bacterium]
MAGSVVRIAIVGANQGVVGGAETYLAWLLATLVTRGHDVAFAFEFAATDPARALDRGIEPLVRWDLKTLNRGVFLEQLTAFQPDIVFLQGCHDQTLELELAPRFRAVMFAHAFYGTCATGWRVHRIPDRRICTRRFGRACLPLNFIRGCGARNPVHLLSMYSDQRDRSNVVRQLAGVVVASQYMRDLYVQHGVPDGDVHVLPPPAEFAPDPFPPAARESRDRIIFLGRLISSKGAVRAVQAAGRCQRALGRPLHLTLAGEGPELARCQRVASNLGVRTDFPGWVGREERLKLLRNADVLIVPSLWPEPFGMVGIEAASVGVPAVGYGVGGIVDWLRPGASGELAEGTGFGPRPLADALERALRSAEHHRKLQLGAWRMAHEFRGDRHVSRLEKLFYEICEIAPGFRHRDSANHR